MKPPPYRRWFFRFAGHW